MIHRSVFRSSLALFASVSLAHADSPVRAFARYPDNANPGTTIAGRDGNLYGVIQNVGDRPAGLVYRVTPNGSFQRLHEFPAVQSAPGINVGGSWPTRQFTMAEDGCLYGLTATGGLYGYGVLYRVRPDGRFSVVADLDTDSLPPGTFSGAYFVMEARSFMEGPDHAFYVLQPSSGSVVRIGRDGVMSVVGNAGYAYQVLRDPAEPFHMLAVTVQQPPFSGPFRPPTYQLRVRRFSIPDGAVVSDITGPVLEDAFSDPGGLQWTAQGLLVAASFKNSPGKSSRMFRLNLDGTMVALTDFAWSADSPLPPELYAFIQAKEDGTLYYTTRNADGGYTGVPGGRTLIELKPDGQFRRICGFGKQALFDVVEGADHSLFGTSYGDKVYVPHDGSGYFMDWMEESNAANFDVIDHDGNGGMFVQIAVDGNPVTGAPPIAGINVLRSKGTSMVIDAIVNDYDTEGGAVQLLSAGPASQGTAVIEPDASGVSKIRFTPPANLRSAVIPYQVTDAGNVPSTGTILVRGAYAGKFVDPNLTVEGQALAISVSQSGAFSAKISNGNGGVEKLTGELDAYDIGLASRLLSTGSVISLSAQLVTEDGMPPALDYRIKQADGTQVTGRAIQVP